LPVPVSPVTSTAARVGPTWRICSNTWRIASLAPKKVSPGSSTCSRR